MLLNTDGVTEARSPKGAFYPLTERAASAPASGPEALIRHIHRDLLNHIGHEPGDDAALLAIERYGALHRPRSARTGARPVGLRPAFVQAGPAGPDDSTCQAEAVAQGCGYRRESRLPPEEERRWPVPKHSTAAPGRPLSTR
ncbi:SpoIIE family protein phosphatase [Streptomyces sp. NPDC051452]|uniref:SpoIIE family protein phosphatase n=1 Tax=Streptomyces sp. NPDC051452 TaxID=3365654 RepID=UPI003794CEF9